ncbi:hypothetical protein [Kitasatospora sp. NPDC088346]|uniref:hypothetical protein n=1 Tax=Kitasatospora sp. NPDC088346 TaxID=3364073 RepID=UPI003800FB6B
MQKITQVAAAVTLAGAAALVTGCSSVGAPASPRATGPAPSAPVPVSPSPSMASQPVKANWAQSVTAGAAAVMHIVLQGSQPSPETCAAQWNELPAQEQATLDRAGFDAGCTSTTTPAPTATP